MRDMQQRLDVAAAISPPSRYTVRSTGSARGPAAEDVEDHPLATIAAERDGAGLPAGYLEG